MAHWTTFLTLSGRGAAWHRSFVQDLLEVVARGISDRKYTKWAALVSLPVLAWWGLFLVVVPYTTPVEEQES